ncbi:MAG: radical SAM protein [Ignavibacteria bacterium]|nr:radical SAM protein [Ignavibacteria bacterium]
MIVFGPVPSRRLGKSLGINNIPPKHCTYNCIYCQVGKTSSSNLISMRKYFYDTEWLTTEVFKKIKELKSKKIHFDYLTFVPDGEPTLDINLGEEIRILKKAGYKVAVITNASLLWKSEVQKDLMKADYISAKVDTVSEIKWRQINRPNNTLNHKSILEGLINFSKVYKGVLTTETMIIKGINDGEKDADEFLNYFKKIGAEINYLMVPLRPPVEERVKIPEEETIVKIYGRLQNELKKVELLMYPEPDDFSTAGNLENEILKITSVHPMREDSLKKLILKNEKKWNLIQKLIDKGNLKEVIYDNQKYFTRIFKN